MGNKCFQINVSVKVPVCYLPHTSDKHGEHVMKVRDSVKDTFRQTKRCTCKKTTKNKNLLVVIQSQGRLGDEISNILTPDFIDEHNVQDRKIMLAVIRDDENTVTDSSVVHSAFPHLKDNISVVDIHVIPNKDSLHDCSGSSNRNEEAQENFRRWAKDPSPMVKPK